jgi:methyl-accepting chemotaxis protein
MKLLTTIRIRTKLLIIVIFMVMGIIGVGLTGYIYNSKSAAALDEVYVNNMVAIEKLSDMRTNSRANFANMLNLMVTEDMDQKAEILENYNTRITKIDEDLKAFIGSGLDESENAKIEELNTNLSSWSEVCGQIIALVDEGKVAEAIELFKGSGEDVFEKLQTSVRDLETYQKDEVQKVYEESQMNNRQAIVLLVIIILFASLFCMGLSFLISLSITRPIKRVLQLIQKTSKLDLTHDSSYDKMILYKDEVGDISRAIDNLRVSLSDFSINLLHIVKELDVSSKELEVSTGENSKTIEQITIAINEIAQGNSSQAGEISKTSEAAIEITDSVKDINEVSNMSAEHAEQSRGIIEGGKTAIGLTVEKLSENIKVSDDVNISISELSEQMVKVGEIVNVIRQISSQTNLLALNASIEAARAGEAGRGFAVVASEIGNLAKSTSSAVDDISNIIDTTVKKSNETSDRINEVRRIVSEQEEAVHITEESFANIEHSVDKITTLALDISHKVSDVANLSERVSERMQDMSAIAEETAAGSQEISASSEEQMAAMEMIAKIASRLSQMAGNLNEEIQRFKVDQ